MGGLAALALVAGGLWFWQRRRSSTRDRTDQQQLVKEDSLHRGLDPLTDRCVLCQYSLPTELEPATPCSAPELLPSQRGPDCSALHACDFCLTAPCLLRSSGCAGCAAWPACQGLCPVSPPDTHCS